MADIIKILNGEAGFSVRDKLNEVIDKVNASAVVVPVGDAPVFDPAKAGGYPAGSIISYRNEASPDTQFQTFAIYVANSDIPVGVSPEDSAEWLFKGVEYTIEGGNTSKNYVDTITALRSVSDMKNGDTMIVGFESRIYEFVESSESGIKPFQAGVGSWVKRGRFNKSGLIDIVDSEKIGSDFFLQNIDDTLIVLVPGQIGIEDGTQTVFYLDITEPSFVVKTGIGFTEGDYKVLPLSPGGSKTYSIDFGTTSIVAQDINMFGAAVIDNIIASNIASILLTYSGGLQQAITPGVNAIAITAGDILTWEITRTNAGQLATLGIHLSLNE